MRKLVSHVIVTLDGAANFDAVVETIGELRDTPEVLDLFLSRCAQEDAMLLGRVTYQEWADYWPTSDFKSYADHINSVPKYVASSTLEAAPWGAHEPATVMNGDLFEAVRALKEQPGGNIGVHGSPTLTESLLQADLVDELRLEIYPVVAGTGERLFHPAPRSKRLRLLDTMATSNGVLIASYGPAQAGPGIR